MPTWWPPPPPFSLNLKSTILCMRVPSPLPRACREREECPRREEEKRSHVFSAFHTPPVSSPSYRINWKHTLWHTHFLRGGGERAWSASFWSSAVRKTLDYSREENSPFPPQPRHALPLCAFPLGYPPRYGSRRLQRAHHQSPRHECQSQRPT